MPVFTEHRAELGRAVFEHFATTATRTGYALAFPVRIRRRGAEGNGVAYEVTTAQIYTVDAQLAVGEQITISGGRTWVLDGLLERDALTETFTLRAT